MAQIKPLPGYVLVEPIEDESKTTGGLYLPEASKDKPSKGKVVACGDGIWVEREGVKGQLNPPVFKGQTVVYKKWTNQEVTHEGKEYLLVAFSELLATIE